MVGYQKSMLTVAAMAVVSSPFLFFSIIGG